MMKNGLKYEHYLKQIIEAKELKSNFKMKRLILLINVLFVFSILSCNNSNFNDNGLLSTDMINNPIADKDTILDESELPKFKFEETSFDFGVLVEGEKVKHSFKYKNVGNTDLIISSVSTTCGCTVPSFSKKPLKPGQEEELEVVFSSSGKHGMQHKTITILANTQPNRTYLEIISEVVAPDELNQ